MKIYETIEISSETHQKLQVWAHWSCMVIMALCFGLVVLNNSVFNMVVFVVSIGLYIVVNYHIVRGVVYSKPKE